MTDLLRQVSAEIAAKVNAIRAACRADGGMPAYRTQDESGVWTSAEVLYTLLRYGLLPADDPVVRGLADFVVQHQHADGGWSYRTSGNSFTDPTCWATLALTHFPNYHDHVRRAVEFILGVQHADPARDDGWGIQAGERDRTYSTVMAMYTLSKMRGLSSDMIADIDRGRLGDAVDRALAFLGRSKNRDGGWGAYAGGPSNAASTAQALQVLFVHAVDPAEHLDSLDFLLRARREGLFVWDSVDEVLPLEIGLEVTMQWFAHPECLKTLIFYAELDLLEIEPVVEATRELVAFAPENGDGVDYVHKGSNKQYTWTVPYYVEALFKAKKFFGAKRREYNAYVQKLAQERESRERKLLHLAMQERFPFPVTEVFSRFARITDSVTRFRCAILTLEALVTFFASATIVCYSRLRGGDTEVAKDIAENIARPSFGDWIRFLDRTSKDGAAGVESELLTRIGAVLDARVSFAMNTSIGTVRAALMHFVQLRNKYWGHGAMISAYEYKKLVSDYAPLLERILREFVVAVEKYSLFYVVDTEFDEFEEKEVYTVAFCDGARYAEMQRRIESVRRLSKGTSDPELRYLYYQPAGAAPINLYPLWQLSFCPDCKADRFFSLSGWRDSAVEYVSYECGHYARYDNARHLEMLIGRLLNEGAEGSATPRYDSFTEEHRK